MNSQGKHNPLYSEHFKKVSVKTVHLQLCADDHFGRDKISEIKAKGYSKKRTENKP